MKIKILGIDPALTNTGLVIGEIDVFTLEWNIVALRLLQTEKSKGKQVRASSDDMERVTLLATGIREFIALHRPTMAAAEVPTGAQSARAQFSNGVVVGLLGSLTLPMVQVNPSEVKIASAGHKYAVKEEMIEWATQRWPALPWLRVRGSPTGKLIADNEHLADACGAVAAAVKSQQFRQASELMRAGMGAQDAIAIA